MLKSPKTTRSVGNNHSQLELLSDSQYKSLLANQLNLKVDLEMRIVDTEERCRRKSTNEAKVVYLLPPNVIPFVRPALSSQERWAASRATRGHSLLRHATPHAPPNILLFSWTLLRVAFPPKAKWTAGETSMATTSRSSRRRLSPTPTHHHHPHPMRVKVTTT